MVGFGRTAGGWPTGKYYQPSLEDFVCELNEARKANAGPSAKLPFPAAWGCDVQHSFKTVFLS